MNRIIITYPISSMEDELAWGSLSKKKKPNHDRRRSKGYSEKGGRMEGLYT